MEFSIVLDKTTDATGLVWGEWKKWVGGIECNFYLS